MSSNVGGGGGCGVLANEYSCAYGAQINFRDLTANLTYDHDGMYAKKWPLPLCVYSVVITFYRTIFHHVQTTVLSMYSVSIGN
jgi:hypothetical protein